MKITKPISEMSDEEYLETFFSDDNEIEPINYSYLYTWIERNIKKYGDFFVNNDTFKLLDLERIEEDLNVKIIQIKDMPVDAFKLKDGKFIMVKKK